MLFREQPSDPWQDLDYLLLEAYQIMQDEICSKCGNPVWLCRSDSNSFRFKVETTVCHAERAMKEFDDFKLKPTEREKDNQVKAEWGSIRYTKPIPFVEGDQLPSRTDYMFPDRLKTN